MIAALNTSGRRKKVIQKEEMGGKKQSNLKINKVCL